MLCSLGSPAAISRTSGFRPMALRRTLSDVLPLSSLFIFKKRQQVIMQYSYHLQIFRARVSRIDWIRAITLNPNKISNSLPAARFKNQASQPDKRRADTDVYKNSYLNWKSSCMDVYSVSGRATLTAAVRWDRWA
jgi:hypothetical protein